MYTLLQIAQITGSELAGRINYPVSFFLTDSRSIVDQTEVLFVAIKTSKNNGHNYIRYLIDKGITSFLVQKDEVNIYAFDLNAISFIISSDPLKDLQVLASHHRKQFDIPVIGITGSNGKTMVKEWLYQLLKKDHTICRSPKSFNSQLGVPLSVLNLNHSHTLAIFEAGISLPGEMDKLAAIIDPTIGIVTSIGSAHDEGFDNRQHKIAEKLKLVSACEIIIVNGLNEVEIPLDIRSKTISISSKEESDVVFKMENKKLLVNTRRQTLDLEIPFTDEASIINTATCTVTLLELGIKPDAIKDRIKLLQPLALRLEIKNGINSSLIINDYYNSDLDSLKIALSFLQQQNRKPNKAIIVSDIEQSGMLDSRLYKDVAGLIADNKVDFLVGVGQKISSFRSYFKSGSLFFENTEDFIRNFKSIDHRFSQSTVLLKGARSFGFEAIGNLLQLKSHDTVLEINLNKLIENVNYYRSLLQPDVKLMCMVKAMGYGGGGSELAKTLQHIGVNYLAVAYADEGVELRQSQINLPIMVMSPESDAFEDIINYRLEPELYSFNCLQEFVARLDKMGIAEAYPVHLKIDTGMHRLGFEEEDYDKLVSVIKNTTQLKIQSVFSHLAASDNSNLDDFTREQINKFTSVCKKLEDNLPYSFIKHICNSGAITRFPEAHFNMVRLGIGMHGIGVSEEEQKHLRNVSCLKTKISQIKKVSKGQTIGYNRKGVTTLDTTIAIIPIGYADGFSRALSNGNFGVYIKGTYCKTIGNVCMDMCMIDITHINCNEQDEVIIFENISHLNSMAEAMGTIVYEVLTGVSARVKRVYVHE
ncbi:MAG: alanine racemase [Bacteroidetes bacterium]|nr:alanine racemase [Bacteroidota bacterium]